MKLLSFDADAFVNGALTLVPTAALLNALPHTDAATLPPGVLTTATTSLVLSSVRTWRASNPGDRVRALKREEVGLFERTREHTNGIRFVEIVDLDNHRPNAEVPRERLPMTALEEHLGALESRDPAPRCLAQRVRRHPD